MHTKFGPEALKKKGCLGIQIQTPSPRSGEHLKGLQITPSYSVNFGVNFYNLKKWFWKTMKKKFPVMTFQDWTNGKKTALSSDTGSRGKWRRRRKNTIKSGRISAGFLKNLSFFGGGKTRRSPPWKDVIRRRTNLRRFSERKTCLPSLFFWAFNVFHK